MRFADIKGNADAIKSLSSMAESGRIAHAMLFYENDGCGAVALALAYIQRLNCHNPKNGDSCGECPSCRQISKLIHPDVHFVFPVNKGSKTNVDKPVSDTYITQWRDLVLSNPYFKESDLHEALGLESRSGVIAVQEAKSIIAKLSLTSVSNGYKAVIMYLPECMNQEAANKLLKIIEEPPVKTVFILVTHSPEKVMQTIFSRCQALRIAPLSPAEQRSLKHAADGVETEYFALFSECLRAMVSRDLFAALESGEKMDALGSKEKQKAFCIFASSCLRKIFILIQSRGLEGDRKQSFEDLADMSDEEKAFFGEMAQHLNSKFCLSALSVIDKTVELLGRNVSTKMLFCDMVDRMFVNVR